MLSKFAKSLLAATSLSPVLLVLSINRLAFGDYWTAMWWVVSAVLLFLVFLFLLFVATKKLQVVTVRAFTIQHTDKEVLAFLIAYLLPVIAKETFDTAKDPFTTMVVFIIIFVTIYHSNSFHFNPLLAMVGYHFYVFRTDHSVPLMLITKRSIRKEPEDVEVVQLSDFIYLEVPRKAEGV